MKRRNAARLIALLFWLFVIAPLPGRTGEALIEGTSLRITLPAGWELGPAKSGEPIRNALREQGNGGVEIRVSQFRNWPENLTPPMSLPFECDTILGSFAASAKMPNEATGALDTRPEYFPDEFYSKVLVSTSPGLSASRTLTGCLFLGNSSVLVTFEPPVSSALPKVQTVLLAVVEAGKHQSTVLYAPGSISLPVLNVTASFDSGVWAVAMDRFAGSSRPIDLLVRTGGAVESKFIPLVAKGTCQAGMDPTAFANYSTKSQAEGIRRKNASYVGPNWYPDAFELLFPLTTDHRLFNSRLQATTCRQLDASTNLIVIIFYGADGISEKEAPILARSLEEIALAVLRGPKADGVIYLSPATLPNKYASPPHTSPISAVAGESKTVTSVQDGSRVIIAGEVQAGRLTSRVQPAYPALARQTRIQGTVKLHAIIDKDGSIRQLEVISGHPLLIQSAMDAVKQWKYAPTISEGSPVQVDTEIDVVFALAQ